MSARVRRDALFVSGLKETAEVRRSLGACTEAGRSLRLFIRSVLGSRNQKLMRYGIQPRRKSSLFLARFPAGCELPS